MNFYKHHLGDYAAATAHLSWDEDCAYRRLIDQYYKREAPIPSDLKEASRLVRASTPTQRRAVETVLAEFFTLAEDGWHQKRCDEEISAASAQAETNRRIAEEREARKRSRKVNESLHDASHDQGTNRELSTSTIRGESVNLARLQTPDSRLQTPEIPPAPPDATTSRGAQGEPEPPTPAPLPGSGSPYGLAALAMRQQGCDVSPGDPRLRTLVDQGATLEEFEAAGAEAAKAGKRAAWALAALINRRAEAAKTVLAAAPAGPAWHETRDGVSKRGQELGLGRWQEVEQAQLRKGISPSYAAYRTQVIAADSAAGGAS